MFLLFQSGEPHASTSGHPALANGAKFRGRSLTVPATSSRLARLHVEYESLEPFPLKYVETERAHGTKNVPWLPKQLPLSYRVESKKSREGKEAKEDKMRLAKDRKSLKVNETLTLVGIPAEAYEYKLGNRSALEWVIDQYCVTEDKRSGIRSDPNRAEDPEYIVRLVGQVIRVSVETARIVKSLPAVL